jgi:segregation and condensation protein B
MSVDPEHLRMAEAILFAAPEPITEADLAARLPDGVHVPLLLGAVQAKYESAGVNLVKRGGRWLLQTAPDLAFLMRQTVEESRKLSRAAVETLAIVAYHQHDRGGKLKGVSRAEIEDIRGVAISKGTLDVLMEAGWVKPIGKRETAGRPTIYGTTVDFLTHFGLSNLKDLPGIDELRAAGLLDPFDLAVAVSQTERDADEPDADTDEAAN